MEPPTPSAAAPSPPQGLTGYTWAPVVSTVRYKICRCTEPCQQENGKNVQGCRKNESPGRPGGKDERTQGAVTFSLTRPRASVSLRGRLFPQRVRPPHAKGSRMFHGDISSSKD